jgi:serine/threonine protein kinase/Tol biopolymer transport system component
LDRTLQPEDRIAHYRVVGPLATGGMGEVYIAQDQTLERSVALKVLPANLVRNEERVRRFVTEAKSASSLSHPHIVTIYEIGQDRVRSGPDGDTDPESDPIHYISMELVTGETLKDKIHHERTDLRTLLGYLVQAAEGLAKAHASGIVHRDLKPSNIMISRDGYAKVLDFGLAKLTERESAGADLTSAATEAADATGEGVVLGTVGYLSPEQVRGKAVDHRADIFSFGCVLYEAATRRRPFSADSHVETMHQILHQQPDPVENVAPETPNALRRLIRRCLAKSPDQRLQSMKDLAIELQDIVDEFDSLAPSGSASSLTPPPAAAPRSGHRGVVPAVIAVAVAAVAVAVWALVRGNDSEPPAAPSTGLDALEMTSLLSAERISDPVLSRDGRYLAYVDGPTGERSLWVRQVATGSQVRVAGPERTLSRISFSPDGNYVFFSMRDPETPNYSAIFSVPSLGGTPRKRLFDVDTPLSFSPDGTRACFIRGVPQDARLDLVIVDLESGRERVLASHKHILPEFLPPAWSPDGRSIAMDTPQFEGGFHHELQFHDVETGQAKTLRLPIGFFLQRYAWLPDGSSLVASADEMTSLARPQVWLLPLPGGGPRRVTNDLNSYGSVSVGDDGNAIAAVRETRFSNLWTVAADRTNGGPRQITRGGGGAEDISNLLALGDGSLAFVGGSANGVDVWRMAADGTDRRQLTTGRDLEFEAKSAGGTLVCGRATGFVPHVWKLDPEGGNERQLTDGIGERPIDLSPDGQSLLFARVDDPAGLWLLPSDGGEPRRLVDDLGSPRIEYSPDGRWILYGRLAERSGRWRPTTVVIPADGGEQVAEFLHPAITEDVEWLPDGRGISFASGSDGEARNIYRMTRDAPEPEAMTHFPDGGITGHEWSPDGSRMFVGRRVGTSVSLWIVPVDGEPYAVATFPTGALFEACWLADGKTIAFGYGNVSQDVVLLRGFR